MKKGIRLAFVIAVVFIAGVLIMAGSAVAKENPKLNATDNITEAEQIATEQNKGVFIVFTSDMCSWCDKLEQDTLNDERIISALNEKYVTAIVHVEEQPDVAKAFNAFGTPIMILTDSNGTEQERLNGYYGPSELLEYL